MSNPIAVKPIRSFDATIRPPGSKSLTNRALLLAALADGESTLTGVLDAEDTRGMLNALTQIGVQINTTDHGEDGLQTTIQGTAGQLPAPPADNSTLHIGNAGTAIRFLCAACCLGTDTYTLDGIKRMRQRPISQLVDALKQIGGNITYLVNQGYPPIQIQAATLTGGELQMPPALSSQYISALLQVAPYTQDGLTLTFDGPITSRPYVAMTLGLMHRFGVTAQVDPNWTRIHVDPARYTATNYHVEPDASNASYFLAAAAVTPNSKCTIQGLGKASLQGDVGFADALTQMGSAMVFGNDFITVMSPPVDQPLRGIDVDLNHMPDMAQTLAVVALFAKGPTVIRNVGNLRVKETDRLHALQVELTKLGAGIDINGDDIEIHPPADGQITPAAIDTYDDHRMAMSFAVAGLRAPGIVINDPDCVHKTFPKFFDYLDRLGNTST